MSTITVKLSRGENTPWGFRLQGGKDFSAPLSIGRVNPDSIAERAGLQTGDAILKIMGHSTDTMKHKEAQDTIVKSGNQLEMTVERGKTRVWKPAVVPIGDIPAPSPQITVKPVTKTSLVANKQEVQHIGSKHNVSARPFSASMQDGTVKAVVHKQYNSPANIYSMDNIAETLSAQTEVLASGAKGINFLKDEQPINKESAVYRMVMEEKTGKESPVHERLTSLKHVEAPVTKPPSEKPAEQLNPNQCVECGKIIIGVFVRIKDKPLHPECFRCSTCGTALKNIGYYNVNDKLYCDIHAKQASKMLHFTMPDYEPITLGQMNSDSAPAETVPGSAPTTPATAGPISPPITFSTPFSPVQPKPSPIKPMPNAIQKVSSPIQQMKPASPPVVAPTMKSFTPLTTHPQTAPSADAHKPLSSGSKFIWPPPKQTPVETLESNATPSVPSYRPPPGTQHISNAPTTPKTPTTPKFTQPTTPKTPTTPTTPKLIQPIPKIPPNVAPKPHIPVQSITTTSIQSWTSSSTSGPSPIGMTSGIGSHPAPRRGRGQLRSQVGPGVRIPICAVCGSPIRGPFIVAIGKSWCPDHFLCSNSQCRRSLQDTGFVEEHQQLYCEHCYEAYFAPMCSKCGARIKGDCLNALDKQWHPQCFVCAYCHRPFGNSSFYMEDGQPYCEKDWNELFTTKCVGCGFPIEAGDRWVEALNNNYHSQCFKCTICHKNLEGQGFYAKGGRPFCKAHAR